MNIMIAKAYRTSYEAMCSDKNGSHGNKTHGDLQLLLQNKVVRNTYNTLRRRNDPRHSNTLQATTTSS